MRRRAVGIVVSAEYPACVVEVLGSGERVQAVLSRMMRRLWVVVNPKDVVGIEFDGRSAEVTYRWWRASVVSISGGQAKITPTPSGLHRNPFVGLPPRDRLLVRAGDTVICSRSAVIDVSDGGRPMHPDRLLDDYALVPTDMTARDVVDLVAADDPPIDLDLVRHLVDAQFPHWADLPLREVEAWDNAVYRLGADMAVRLTRGRWALGQLEREFEWLPRFVPHLPLPISLPIAQGAPTDGYPWRWGVYTWIAGEQATPDRLPDQRQAARDLGAFVRALQAIPTGGASIRGAPRLEALDTRFRSNIERATNHEAARVLRDAWDRAIAARWDGVGAWRHGDLTPTNILASGGRISGVIDFGVLSVGDPAYDYAVAWRMFSVDEREAFRDAVGADDATWARARGWAVALLSSRAEVIADYQAGVAVEASPG